MKFLKKIFYIIIAIVVSGIAISGLAIIVYKEKIIDLLKSEIDRHITTQLEVKNIDLKLIKGFPNVSIQFTDVEFHSSFENELLLKSDQIYFVLNIIDLLNNVITVERLEIENAKIILHKNSNGDNNYNVFNVPTSTSPADGSFNIKSTKFSNVEILNIDDVRNIDDEYSISSLRGSANFINGISDFKVISDVILTKTSKSHLDWLIGKKVHFKINTAYEGKVINFKSSRLEINSSQFNITGFVGMGTEKKILINLTGNDLKFSNVITLLPNEYKNKLTSFRGKGLIEFDALLKGSYANNDWPGFEVSFRLKEFEVEHKDMEYPMNDIYLEGNVLVPDVTKLENGTFEIKKFSTSINKKKVEVVASIKDFNNPNIRGVIQGEVDCDWVISLLIKDAHELYGLSEGHFDINLDFGLNVIKIDNKYNIQESVFNGKVLFNNVCIDSIYHLALKDVNGELSFFNDKIVLSNLTGTYGASDFNLDGMILTNQPLISRLENKVEAKINLTSNKLELDEIIEIFIGFSQDLKSTKEKNPVRYNIDLNLEVRKLLFRKFQGENFNAEALISHRGLKIARATSNGLGGSIKLVGGITKQFNGDYYIETKVATQSVHLDSMFYIFDNYKQDFITDSVIKGELNSEVYTYMYFDRDWKFKRELLYAEGLLKVKNGELNNFKPMMSLSSYLKDEDENLSKLRFSDLESRIIISNDTVYISDMYIGSNVRNIKIGGYHTLNQHIDYRLSVPISGRKTDRDKEFGEIKKDKDGKFYMPFRIKGTTTDYQVNYDLKRASYGLLKGVKKELTEIGKSFKGNKLIEEKEDTLLLEEDEFFEWDDN